MSISTTECFQSKASPSMVERISQHLLKHLSRVIAHETHIASKRVAVTAVRAERALRAHGQMTTESVVCMGEERRGAEYKKPNRAFHIGLRKRSSRTD